MHDSLTCIFRMKFFWYVFFQRSLGARQRYVISAVQHRVLCAFHIIHFNFVSMVIRIHTESIRSNEFPSKLFVFVFVSVSAEKIGAANGVTITCPSNTACSDTSEVCISPTISFDCAPVCGTCSPDGRFACLNSTTYALCFGAPTPNTSITSSCPPGLFCDVTVAAPQFCSNRSMVRQNIKLNYDLHTH